MPKKSVGAANRKAAAVKCAASVTGLTRAEVKDIDEKLKKKGKRPLSFLASQLHKLEKDVRALARKGK